MLVPLVSWSLLALAAYLALGLVFAVPFLAKWVKRIDPDAAGGSWGFKLLVLPGAVALWPLMALRVRSGVEGLPVERTPHRRAAGSSPEVGP